MLFKKILNKFVLIFNSVSFRLLAFFKYRAVISPRAELRVERGASFSLGRNSRITAGTIIHVYSGASLNIEDNVWIGPYNVLYCKKEIFIARNVRIAHFCTITDNDYYLSKDDIEPIDFNRSRCGKIMIGANSWICANVTILRDARIADNQVVKPGSCIRRKK